MGALFYAAPIISGLAMAYIFSWQVNIAAGALALACGGFLAWQTKDAEIGAIIGIVAMIVTALFAASVFVGTLIFNGVGVDLSWIIRGGRP